MINDSQASRNSVHWTKTIDSALLILLLTASSYAIAFQYEAGYLSHFGVPAEYAEVNAGRLITAAGATFFCITTAVFLWTTIKALLSRVAPLHLVVTNRLAYLATWVVISLLFANEIEGSWFVRALICSFPVIMLVGELTIPLFSHRNLTSYAAKLEASISQDIAREPADPTSELTAVVVRIASPAGAGLLFAVFLMTAFAHAAGVHVARLQSDFLVAKAEFPCIVIRSLSEGLLCVSVDAKTKASHSEYRFLKPEGTVVNLSSIGPLAKAEPQQVTPQIALPRKPGQ
jgi:hypothetical protein